MTVALGEGEFIFTVDYTDMQTALGSDSVEVPRVVEMAEPPPSGESEGALAGSADRRRE